MAEETLIANGNVLDGSGSSAVAADVRIRDGRIVEVQPGLTPNGATVIDVAGLTVAPGFIDAHTHAEFVIAAERSAHYMEPFVRQGITTMVTGNCGVSPAPFDATNAEHMESYWDCLLPEEGLPWAWNTMGDFLKRLDGSGAVLNLAQLVGHGAVRLWAMGYRPGAPTGEELRTMRALVRESLADGAVGLSYGLSYVPGIWADTEELIEVARDVPDFGGVISVHLRSQGQHIESAVQEMIRVAETVGAPLQLSHYGPFSVEFTEPFFRTLEAVESARERGVRIGCDMVCPPVSSTTVCHFFPAWMFEGGFGPFFDRLADPALRSRLVEEMTAEPSWPSWETGGLAESLCTLRESGGELAWKKYRINGFRTPALTKYEFWSVDAIAEERGTDPYETLFDIILAERARLFFTGVNLDNDDLDRFAGVLYQMPEYSFMTDSVGIGRRARATNIYGTFPRFLGRHAREWNTFSLEEAVRKSTSLPAAQYGLTDRGHLRPGQCADIVVFDPATIRDTATFAQPYQYPEGIPTVLINGVPVWHDGRFDAAAMAGKVIRRE